MKEKKPLEKQLVLAAILSVLLHLIISILFIQNEAPLTTLPAQPEDTIDVRIMSDEELQQQLAFALDADKKKIVQTDSNLTTKDAPKTKERVYLSKTNQQTKQNTKAARFGEFKNVLNQGQEKTFAPENVSDLFDLQPSDNNSLSVKEKSNTGKLTNAPKNDNLSKTGDGFSSTDDYLPEVAIGSQTLLNANEYKYYGFYERIRTQLKDRWYREIDLRVRAYFAKNKVNLVNTTKITQVDVTLGKNGQLIKIEITSSSGIKVLDDAAIRAFQQAAPFPNPPQEILSAITNKVSVKWDFIVVAQQDTSIHFELKRPNDY